MGENETGRVGQGTDSGSDNLLSDIAGWALVGAFKGISKIGSVIQAKKWKKLASSIKAGDAYSGIVRDNLSLEIDALKDVNVGLALVDASTAAHVDGPGAEILRECYGEEGKLAAAIRTAERERQKYVYAFAFDPTVSSVKTKSFGTVPVKDRNGAVRAVLSSFAKDSEPLDLKVAYVDDARRAILFCCEKIERAFASRIRGIREAYELTVRTAVEEHTALHEQAIFNGEIVRAPEEPLGFVVRLDGVAMHNVELDFPQMSPEFASRYAVEEYICKNWLTKHEFVVTMCIGTRVRVRSVTIDKALGIGEDIDISVPYVSRAQWIVNDGCLLPKITPRSDPSSMLKSQGVSGFVPRTSPDASSDLAKAAKKADAVVVPMDSLVVIDGSNVIGIDCELRTRILQAIVEALVEAGYRCKVFVDKTIFGWLRNKKHDENGVEYLTDGEKSGLVIVAPSKTEADGQILQLAEFEGGVHIITNDRYRDYAEMHPWLKDGGSANRLHGINVVPMGDGRSRILLAGFNLDISVRQA